MANARRTIGAAGWVVITAAAGGLPVAGAALAGIAGAPKVVSIALGAFAVLAAFAGVFFVVRDISARDSRKDCDAVRILVGSLGERRAVIGEHCVYGPEPIALSVSTLREWVSEALNTLSSGGAGTASIVALRTACNTYLTAVERAGVSGEDPTAALFSFRESFRVHLLMLATDYNLAEARDLASRINRSDTVIARRPLRCPDALAAASSARLGGGARARYAVLS